MDSSGSGTDQRLTLVNTVMNIWVLRIERQVISLQPTVSFSRKTQLRVI